MDYLLIILVIAVALAPLAHFVPSKRQRQVARMREYAAVNGLFVEFRGLPGPAGKLRGGPPGAVIYYGKRLPPPRGGGSRRGCWLHEQEGWHAVDRRQPVPGSLSGFPPEILAASVDEGSCGAYWQEAGEEEDVEGIRAVLERWAQELTS